MGLNSADPLIHRIFSVNTVKIYFLFLRLSFLFYFKDFIYFFFRERGREGEREGEKYQRVVASHIRPLWGPGLQLRLVP